jgi:hypothetical protein
MPSFRITFLMLTLGLAATMGGLRYPSSTGVDLGTVGRSDNGPVIHPGSGYHHGRHSVPGRQRTKPDPTPDDGIDDSANVMDFSNHGSEWFAFDSADQFVIDCLFESPSSEWGEPTPDTHLFQVTHRFRC